MRTLLRIAVLLALPLGGVGLPLSLAHAQSASAPDQDAQAALLEGVRAFRSEQFEQALSIFRNVEQGSGRRDIGLYLGMALHKLGRHGEALAAFRAARGAGVTEPIADYYDAVSCFRLGLFERARLGFAKLLTPADQSGSPALGPRLREGAQKFSAAIDKAAPKVADPSRPDALPARRFEVVLKQAQDLVAKGSPQAPDWLEEAALLLPLLPGIDQALAASRLQETKRQLASQQTRLPGTQPDDLPTPKERINNSSSR